MSFVRFVLALSVVTALSLAHSLPAHGSSEEVKHFNIQKLIDELKTQEDSLEENWVVRDVEYKQVRGNTIIIIIIIDESHSSDSHSDKIKVLSDQSESIEDIVEDGSIVRDIHYERFGHTLLLVVVVDHPHQESFVEGSTHKSVHFKPSL